MTIRTSASATAPGDFAAVPVRPRCDGWTADRQRAFVAALAETANVEAACRAVGMGTSSVYDLRARADAAAFRAAWDAALDYAVHRVAEAALDRAINGTVTPIFYRGERIGERRVFSESLTQFILRTRDTARFGAWRTGVRGTADGASSWLHAATRALHDLPDQPPVPSEPDRQGGMVPPVRAVRTSRTALRARSVSS